MIRERQRGAVSIHALFQAVAMFVCYAGWFFFVTLFAGKDLVGGFEGYSLYGGIAVAALLLRAAYCADEDAAKLSGLFPSRLLLASLAESAEAAVTMAMMAASDSGEILLPGW